MVLYFLYPAWNHVNIHIHQKLYCTLGLFSSLLHVNYMPKYQFLCYEKKQESFILYYEFSIYLDSWFFIFRRNSRDDLVLPMWGKFKRMIFQRNQIIQNYSVCLYLSIGWLKKCYLISLALLNFGPWLSFFSDLIPWNWHMLRV